MKSFLIYKKSNEKEAGDFKLAFIEEKINLKAMLFGSIWFLFNKMWDIALIIFIIETLAVKFFPRGEMAMVFMTTFRIALGLFASELSELSFRRQGFKFDTIISSHDTSSAEMKYFEKLTV